MVLRVPACSLRDPYMTTYTVVRILTLSSLAAPRVVETTTPRCHQWRQSWHPDNNCRFVNSELTISFKTSPCIIPAVVPTWPRLLYRRGGWQGRRLMCPAALGGGHLLWLLLLCWRTAQREGQWQGHDLPGKWYDLAVSGEYPQFREHLALPVILLFFFQLIAWTGNNYVIKRLYYCPTFGNDT